MAQARPPAWFAVFVAGLVAGMIVGIGIKTGITPDEAGVLLFVLQNICALTEDMDKIELHTIVEHC